MRKVFGYLLVRKWGLCVAACGLLVDAISKGEILKALWGGALPVWWVPEQLGLAFAWNRGMSFSLLQDVVWGPWFLGVVAVLVCAWFVHWMGEEVQGTRYKVQGQRGEAGGGRCWVMGFSVHQVGLGLIVGGAVGNLLDRVQHGAVVDFIVVNPWGWFPYTFNVADACITVGVGLLLLDGFWSNKGNKA